MNILEMNLQQILSLDPKDVTDFLTPMEVLHIAKVLDAYWAYDYAAADQGRLGKHALLKSMLHSDVFFVSRILLEPENIREIIAMQMVQKWKKQTGDKIHPSCVIGVPDGATSLAKEISRILGVPLGKMIKENGIISLDGPIENRDAILEIEDICTRGTGFKEGVGAVRRIYPHARILPFDPVIINRGGLTHISMEGEEDFLVVPVVNIKANDWKAEDCPLCMRGSVAIKPKVTAESWIEITTSQRAA